MNTEKLKPFNEFNSEKSAMVNEICYRLFKELDNIQSPQIPIKELKKVEIPTQISPNTQIAVTIGTAAEYDNTGFVPILVEAGNHALAFGKYTDGSDTKLVIKNTSPTAVFPGEFYICWLWR